MNDAMSIGRRVAILVGTFMVILCAFTLALGARRLAAPPPSAVPDPGKTSFGDRPHAASATLEALERAEVCLPVRDTTTDAVVREPLDETCARAFETVISGAVPRDAHASRESARWLALVRRGFDATAGMALPARRRLRVAVIDALVSLDDPLSLLWPALWITRNADEIVTDDRWLAPFSGAVEAAIEEDRRNMLYVCARRARRGDRWDYGVMRAVVDEHIANARRGREIELSPRYRRPGDIACLSRSYDACRRMRSRAFAAAVVDRLAGFYVGLRRLTREASAAIERVLTARAAGSASP